MARYIIQEIKTHPSYTVVMDTKYGMSRELVRIGANRSYEIGVLVAEMNRLENRVNKLENKETNP